MQENAAVLEGNAPPEAARTRLVIVEDDPSSLDMLSLMAQRLGHDVVGRADNAGDALALAEQLQPHLVLADIFLRQDPDGITLCQAVQEKLSIPVVLVTGHTDETLLARAAKAAPYGLVFKPVQLHQMQIAIQSALRRKAEESRHLAESQFKTIFEQAAVGIAFLAFNGDYLRVNQRLCDMLGYSHKELARMNWRDITHPDDVADNESLLDRLYNREIPFISQEKRYIHRTGHQLWVKITVSLATASGDPRQYRISIVEDITERKLAQDRLAASEELLRNILTGIKAGIIITDPATHTILDVNTEAERIFGVPREDLIGRPCGSIAWLDIDGRPLTGQCSLATTPGESVEFRVERPDGRTIPIVKIVVPAVRDDTPLLYEVIFDFTARKNLERRLSIAQRLESIGELASGIAHEINTPIQYIGDNLSFLKDAFAQVFASAGLAGDASPITDQSAQDEELDFLAREIPKAIDQSLEGVSRVAAIVRAMKRFSHAGGEDKVRLDVHRAIETTVEIARNEWKYHAEVELDLDEAAQYFTCVPGDFNQVLLNLLVNAAHAVTEKYKNREEKGVIRIRAARENGFLIVSVADTGCGIPGKNIHRIFDPFFTTKEVGKGTGQGLAIAHDIVVDKHSGSIDVQSEPGQGTTFTLRFPMDGPEPASP